MFSKSKIQQLEKEISDLKYENKLLKIELEAIRSEYAEREKPPAPKYFISCEKYLQMIDYLKDGLIIKGSTLAGSLELLNAVRNMALEQE